MHESPDNATGSLGEASFWRGHCAATLRQSQWVASLCVVIAEEGPQRTVIDHELSPCRIDMSLKSSLMLYIWGATLISST